MQSVSLYRTRILVEATGVAGSGSILEILAVADLLHDPPDTLVVVDRVQQILGGDGRGGRALGLAPHLHLERTPDDHRDVGATPPAPGAAGAGARARAPRPRRGTVPPGPRPSRCEESPGAGHPCSRRTSR